MFVKLLKFLKFIMKIQKQFTYAIFLHTQEDFSTCSLCKCNCIGFNKNELNNTKNTNNSNKIEFGRCFRIRY